MVYRGRRVYHRKQYRRGRPREPWESRFDTFDPGDDYFPYTAIGGSFYVANKIEDWRIRGKRARDYYKNTGYKPRYYNNATRRRIKW